MTFQSNRVYCSTLGLVYASGVPGGAEYDVECEYEILTDVSSMGIAGRVSTSADTFYYCYYLAGEVVLAKRVASTITSLTLHRDRIRWDVIPSNWKYGTQQKKYSLMGWNDVPPLTIPLPPRQGGIRSGSAASTTTGKHIRNFRRH